MNLMVVDLTIFPWKLYFSLGQAFDTSIPMFVGLKVFKLAMVFIGETTWCSYSCRYMTTVAFFMDLWVSDGESAGSPRSDGANGCASYGWYRRSWKAKRLRSPRAKPSWCPISWRKLRTSPSNNWYIFPVRLFNFMLNQQNIFSGLNIYDISFSGELLDLLGAGSLYNFRNFTIIPQIQKICFSLAGSC